MAQQLKIKRSTTTAIPTAGTLTSGELAYTEVGGIKRLFVGQADNSTAFEIGGQSYALLASPTFTGTPLAPTATLGTNTTQIATTAFVLANATSKTLTSAQIFVGNASNVATGVAVTGDLSITNAGVTTVGSATPTASTVAKWNANINLSANNHLNASTTIATTGGTTTLTVSSTYYQYFTGTTTQIVALPVATTLSNGLSFSITNTSSGVVTVQTSGGNIIQAMASNTTLTVTCINTAGGTGAASWSWVYNPIQAALPTSSTLTSANIYVGNSSNVATGVALTGDLGITNTGVTTVQAGVITGAKIASATITAANIVNNTITATQIANATITGTQIAANTVANSNLSQMATLTLKGNNTGGTANASDLTVAQVNTMLGLTSSTTPTASIIAKWDANLNLSANNLINAITSTATAGSTTSLTIASTEIQRFTGTNGQTIILPNATSLTAGLSYTVLNESSVALTIQNGLGAGIGSVNANSDAVITLAVAGTGAGTWHIQPVALSSTLNSGNIFIGNGSNIATGVALSGDATITSAGVITLGTANVTGKLLTGYTPTAGAISATDTILQAIQKTGASLALSSGQIILGNASNIATPTTITGDLSITNAGVTTVGTTTPTASTVAKRDANANLSATNFLSSLSSTVTSGAITTLGIGAAQIQRFTGSSTQTVVLPNATSLAAGTSYTILNESTNLIVVQNNAISTISTVSANSDITFTLAVAGTQAGTWHIQPTAGSISATVGSVLFSGGGSTVSQDNANFFYDNTNDRLGLGTNSPTYRLDVRDTTTTQLALTSTGAQGANNGAGLVLVQNNGAAMAVGNSLGSLSFSGAVNASNGTGVGAQIKVNTVVNWTGANYGSSMSFQTVPNGSTALTTALTLAQDQSAIFANNVSINGYFVATSNLGLQASFTSNASAGGPGGTIALVQNTAIINGNTLGTIQFSGNPLGGSPISSSQILSKGTQTWVTASARGSEILFQTVPNNSITPTTALTLGQDQSATFAGNATANNHINAYTTIATAAGTTTLTALSTYYQTFTGSSTQTVVLPSSGISSGFSFSITNFSTQIVTVQTASASALQLMAPNTTLVVTCINGTGSGSAIAAWSWNYFSAQPSGLPVSTSSVGLYTAQQNFSLQTLTWASTLAWNLNTQQVAKVTLAGTTTISNPTNMVAGGTYVLFLTQDATGSRTVTWGANYRWSGATAPTLTTTANATDIVTFVSDGSLMYGTATTNFQ